jgi:tetratricopeptide (TPR) repeat protein
MLSAPWVLVACLLAVGVLPRTAQAQDNFKRYFNSAVQLYQRGESELALKQLERAKQHTRDVEQDIAIALYEGLCYADLPQWEDARAAFERALVLDAEAKLPVKASAKVNEFFEETRRKVVGKGAEVPKVTEAEQPKQSPKEANIQPPVPPAPAPYAPSAELAEKPRSRVPTVPLVLGGVGVAAAGVGAVFGMQSRSNSSKVREAYEGGRLPAQSEVSAVDARLDDARGQARMANVLFGTAALAAGGAVVTWLLASDDSAAGSKEAP